MVDMRQYCDNCPIRDTCSLEQKNASIILDHYYTRDGRRIDIVEARLMSFVYIKYQPQSWTQPSFDDIINVPD